MVERETLQTSFQTLSENVKIGANKSQNLDRNRKRKRKKKLK